MDLPCADCPHLLRTDLLDVASLKAPSRLACLSSVSSPAGKTVSCLCLLRSACVAAAGRASGIGQKPAQGACARYVRPTRRGLAMRRLPAFAADGSLDVASLKSTSRLAYLSGISGLAGEESSCMCMRRSACVAAAGRASGIGQKPAQGACARYVRPTQWTCHAQIARICCGRISGRSKSEKHQQTGLLSGVSSLAGKAVSYLCMRRSACVAAAGRASGIRRSPRGSLCTLCEANAVDCHAQIARICCGRISGRSKSEKHQQTGLFKQRKPPRQARLSVVCACSGQPVELLQAAQAA